MSGGDRFGALVAGACVATIALLARFGWDAAHALDPLFAVLAAGGSLMAMAAAGLALGPRSAPPSRRVRLAACAAIPLAFAASSLDCAGLSWEGCTRTCTWLKLGVLPAVSALALVYAWTERRWAAGGVLLGSAVTLWPHCICRNEVNRPLIDLIGASPYCFFWGFVSAVLCIAFAEGRGRALPSLGIAYLSSGASLLFFVGHHYFHFPW